MSEYKLRSNEPGIEDRARNPVKGLRARFRKALIDAGVKAKFRTDERRDGTLVVVSKQDITLPFDNYEGYRVRFILKEINCD